MMLSYINLIKLLEDRGIRVLDISRESQPITSAEGVISQHETGNLIVKIGPAKAT